MESPLSFPSRRCQKRFLQHARACFNTLLTGFQEALDARLAHTACQQAHRDLSQKLTDALVDGETVRFEDAGALGAYTLKRLRSRSRALFEVLLADDCREVLSSLLRRCHTATQQGRQLRVASLGGGPAFDAVALLATMASLAEATSKEPTVQNWDSCDWIRCGVRCTVLDLAPAWGPALSAVAEVSSEIWPHQKPEFVELLAPIDLRVADCLEIIDAVCQADVVVAAYVLHENEAALLTEDGLQGAFPGIFQHLPVDVPLIFLDATHRLWPALLQTAKVAVGEHRLRAIIPEGLECHIHSVLLLKSSVTAQAVDCGPQLEVFAAHQRANQLRLRKLKERDS